MEETVHILHKVHDDDNIMKCGNWNGEYINQWYAINSKYSFDKVNCEECLDIFSLERLGALP